MNELPKEHTLSEPEEAVSKSQLKREAKAVQEFADHLLSLPDKLLVQLPLTDELRDAISVGRKLDNRNARKRQLKYIARLLVSSDLESIQSATEQSHQDSLMLHKRKHQLERWCELLLSGNDELLNELVEEHGNLERQTLRQLIRQALKNASKNQAPPDNRKLFRYLQENTN